MPRARTKQELLDFGETEFSRLMEVVDSFSEEKQENDVVFGNRTIKDILAHLNDWHEMLFEWEKQAKDGEKPVMPMVGFSWKETPEMNEMLYQRSKSRSLKSVKADLIKSHEKAMQNVRNYSDDDLETKKKFAWTGSTNIASYYASATSSHYVWAMEEIKKGMK